MQMAEAENDFALMEELDDLQCDEMAQLFDEVQFSAASMAMETKEDISPVAPPIVMSATPLPTKRYRLFIL